MPFETALSMKPFAIIIYYLVMAVSGCSGVAVTVYLVEDEAYKWKKGVGGCVAMIWFLIMSYVFMSQDSLDFYCYLEKIGFI